MKALRNVSPGQTLHILKTGGAVVHLFPGRALALTEDQLKSSQIKSLIAGGLARIQQIEPLAAARAAKGEPAKAEPAKAEPARHEPEKHEAPERKHEKKKGES